jgi:PAS domain S-box-containing protein
MEDKSEPIPAYHLHEFLSGGGDMGELIRSYDWTKTSLGSVSTWPQSLRTCVRIMLTSRQPIWIGWGKDLVKLYNDPYIAIVGGKHPWALGTPVSEVWSEIRKDIDPLLKRVTENNEGTYVESQLLIMERNGYPEETYYTFSYTPIPGDDGKTAGVFCANSDDTERIISERQLKTLTLLGKNLSDCNSEMEIIERATNTLHENPYDFPYVMFAKISNTKASLAYSTDQNVSETILQLFSDLTGKNEYCKTINDSINTRKILTVDSNPNEITQLPKGAWEISATKLIILPICQQGMEEPFGVLIIGKNPYRLLDEQYESFFALVADQISNSFSDIHRLEEERKRAEALAEIDRAKTLFFSNISHEFRTPLTLLLGPIEDALNDADTLPLNKERMNVAYRNALRMQKLVNTLLEFSRIEAGRMEGKFTETDISKFTKDLASLFRSAIEKAGMQLKFSSSDIKSKVYVDIEMWERIILNLISNAFKYSKEGTISIDIKEVKKKVVVSVKDTGTGIPFEQLDNIFNRFHRVENSGGRSQEGTGIGLALVKELVKLHSGTIDVKSELGKGSEFIVTIPSGNEHLSAEKISEDHKNSSPLHAKGYLEEALKWIPDTGSEKTHIDKNEEEFNSNLNTVLLADDNTDMRDYVKRLLSGQFNVITAVDGEDAFRKILKYKPDLLLSDIMMPGLDGFGLLKRVRNHIELKNIPVIFLSARAGDEAKVEGLDAGADDYLVKPFSAKELLVRVSNHIRINQVRRETEQQFYHLFVESPAIINVFKGPEHVFELFHPKNKEIFGDVDFTGKTMREAIPEIESQGILELLDEVYTTGKLIRQKERLVVFNDKNGNPTERYIDFIYQPWFDNKKKIQGVLNFAIEVTEAVKNRKTIEESENRFRTLAETLPQLIWVTDAEGNQIYVSSKWKNYTGFDHESNVWTEIIHPEDTQRITDAWTNSLIKKNNYKIEVRLRKSDGTYRWFYGQGEPILDEKSAITKWIGTFTDIHNQKEEGVRLENLVKERTIELQRSNEDLQQFAHVASHDLKEPVRKIKTFTERLKSEFGNNIPERGNVFIQKVSAATDRIFSMIDGVLAYSTFNAKEQETKDTDLNLLIKNIETDLELVIQHKKAIIISEKLPVIEGAEVLLYQLFYNLIGNSLKFSQAEVNPVIRISSTDKIIENKKCAEIQIADNGIGFDREYADIIFNTFSRLNSKDKFEGTGLGLALCKKIVQRHNGTISAEGILNEGSVFTITIPYQQLRKTI